MSSVFEMRLENERMYLMGKDLFVKMPLKPNDWLVLTVVPIKSVHFECERKFAASPTFFLKNL